MIRKSLLFLAIFGFLCNPLSVLALKNQEIENTQEEDLENEEEQEIIEEKSTFNGFKFFRGATKVVVSALLFNGSYLALGTIMNANISASQEALAELQRQQPGADPQLMHHVTRGFILGGIGNGIILEAYMFYRGISDMYHAFEKAPEKDTKAN